MIEKILAKHQLVLAVDCIIFGFENKELSILLVRRKINPLAGQWSLMGGFVEQSESLDAAANRVLKQLSGIDNVYLEQVSAFGDPKRDLTGRIVSVVYYAIVNKSNIIISDLEKYDAKWVKVDNVPDLIFDHNQMINAAKHQMKIMCTLHPIGFKLLPKKFTIPDLQALYEAIFEHSLDARNFRRHLLSLGILINLKIKEKNSSKKGAYLYEFDTEKYNQLVNKTRNLSNVFKLF